MFRALDFQFAGRNSAEFGLKIANFDTSSQATHDIGPSYEILEQKIIGNPKPVFYGVESGGKLTFPLTFVYMGNGDNQELSKAEISDISKWLFRREYRELTIVDEEYAGVIYNVILTSGKRIDFGNSPFAMMVTVVCDRPWGFIRRGYAFHSGGGTGTERFRVKNLSSLDTPIYPKMIISNQTASGRTFRIQELNSGDDPLIIFSLFPNEVVTIVGEKALIQSSLSQPICERFNFNWLECGGHSSYDFEITGPVDVIFEFEFPIVQ
jgi:hypothetical protein